MSNVSRMDDSIYDFIEKIKDTDDMEWLDSVSWTMTGLQEVRKLEEQLNHLKKIIHSDERSAHINDVPMMDATETSRVMMAIIGKYRVEQRKIPELKLEEDSGETESDE